MIKIHHLNQSRSTRVLWALEELQLPYEVVHHQRDAITRLAPESIGKIHPLKKAPIIEHDGIVMSESGAILEYLIDQDGQNRLRPEKNTLSYYQYIEWMHFAEGSLALPVISSIFMKMEERDGTKPMDTYIAKELHLDFTYIDEVLSKQTYFAGEVFTAADIMMTITLEIAVNADLFMDKPNITRYLEQVQKREAYQKARLLG